MEEIKLEMAMQVEAAEKAQQLEAKEPTVNKSMNIKM